LRPPERGPLPATLACLGGGRLDGSGTTVGARLARLLAGTAPGAAATTTAAAERGPRMRVGGTARMAGPVWDAGARCACGWGD